MKKNWVEWVENEISIRGREACEHWVLNWRHAETQKSHNWKEKKKKKAKNQTNRPSRTVSLMNNGQILHLHYPIRVDSIYITCAHRSWLWWVFMYARVTLSLLFCFIIIVLFTVPSRSTIHSFVASHWMALRCMKWHGIAWHGIFVSRIVFFQSPSLRQM